MRSLRDLFMDLITSTHGEGPSSIRLVYLTNGLGALLCSLVMTIGGIEVYCAKLKADPVYWAAVAALWTATLGFGAKTKVEQNRGSVQVAIAPHRSQMTPAPVQGD